MGVFSSVWGWVCGPARALENPRCTVLGISMPLGVIPWGWGGAWRRDSTLGGGGARCSIRRRQVSVTTCVHVAYVWSLGVGELVRVGDRVRVCAGEGLPRLPYAWV